MPGTNKKLPSTDRRNVSQTSFLLNFSNSPSQETARSWGSTSSLAGKHTSLDPLENLMYSICDYIFVQDYIFFSRCRSFLKDHVRRKGGIWDNQKNLYVRLSKFSIISIVLNSNAFIVNNRLIKLVLSKQLIESFSLGEVVVIIWGRMVRMLWYTMLR